MNEVIKTWIFPKPNWMSNLKSNTLYLTKSGKYFIVGPDGEFFEYTEEQALNLINNRSQK